MLHSPRYSLHSPQKKPQQTEKLRAHCSEAEVLISCYRKPNVVELIINSIK